MQPEIFVLFEGKEKPQTNVQGFVLDSSRLRLFEIKAKWLIARAKKKDEKEAKKIKKSWAKSW